MMEMTLEAIAFYFTEIQRVLKPGGLFYCVNRYNKKIGDKEIILADYPYDSLWQFIFSQPKWLQPHIHELISRRLASPNPDFPHPVLMNLSREIRLNSNRQ
jgi:ubiquinone/menaquinone biosynthesis C-methylase UbiE